MIQLMFRFANEKILVVIDGNDIKFGNTEYGAQLASIEGLKLDYQGVINEFPELTNRDDWKAEAIKRFKEKIKSFKTENEKANYIIEDLKKYGYVPEFKQKKGFRRERI